MRLLVTGHEGYVGAVLVPMLREAGHEVTGLDLGWFGDCGFPPRPHERAAAEVPALRVDIRDVTYEHCAGFDAVLHLAALSNDPLGNLNPSVTYDINYHAAVRLARAAKTAGVPRFLFSSTCAMYGAGSDDWIDERVSFAPVTPYGESKVLAERRIASLADADFSPVFLRHTTAYGVSPMLRGDLLINNLVAFAVTTGHVVLQGDADSWRPLVHVADIARSYLAVLSTGRDVWHGRAYHVGRSDENHRIADLVHLVCDEVPGAKIEFDDGPHQDSRSYRVDCARISREIPLFQPRWTVAEGVKELAAAYQAEGLRLADFEDRYLRIRRIRRLVAGGVLDLRLRPAGEMP
ncbi:NAD-dependent epimerase/dehydratase [Phytomonospora sp. NPDC050363]|uniref:NAD-dependent epimerase/dehydratase family protein n=1 Tax=Phytomonospora sp. NPDC050363 TaxID=3155642 RepID=UPI0033C34402